jgi:hypothetical protein
MCNCNILKEKEIHDELTRRGENVFSVRLLCVAAPFTKVIEVHAEYSVNEIDENDVSKSKLKYAHIHADYCPFCGEKYPIEYPKQ